MIFPRKILTLPWDGTVQLITLSDLKLRALEYGMIKSHKYCGAVSWYAWYVRMSILKRIRCWIGSQWRSNYVLVMWSNLGILQRIRAAVFNILCSLLKLQSTIVNDMCGVVAKRPTLNCDPIKRHGFIPIATRHICCVLHVGSPNKLNLLSWLLIYLCNKQSTLH